MPRDFANGLKVGDIITVYDRGFMKVVDIVKNYYNNSHYIPDIGTMKQRHMSNLLLEMKIGQQSIIELFIQMLEKNSNMNSQDSQH